MVRRPIGRLSVALGVMLAITVAVCLAAAAGGMVPRVEAAKPPCITCLGKLTNDLPGGYFPLGGFKNEKSLPAKVGGKARILLMGTDIDNTTAALRWPLTKALAQFGSFSTIGADAQNCSLATPTPAPNTSREDVEHEPCGPPTFNFPGARYHSAYLSFAEADLLTRANRDIVSRLSPENRAIYNRFARRTSEETEIDNIWASITGGNPLNAKDLAKRLPLLVIGRYLQAQDQYLVQGDFNFVWDGTNRPFTCPGNRYPQFVTFDNVRSALQTGKRPTTCAGRFLAPARLVSNINTDANLYIALICKADGMKPKSVCGRSAVKAILKHAR